MTLAGLAALTAPAVVDCLATLGITMTSFPDRGYAVSEGLVSGPGYGRFLKDDFFQGLETRRPNEGIRGSVFYDERGWPFPISAGSPDRTRRLLGPAAAWPHLAAVRGAQGEASVEWVPSPNDLGGAEMVGDVSVAWHHAVFFSAWLGWKVKQQTRASVYFRLPTLAEREYPLRKRLGLSGSEQLVESLTNRTISRDDFGSALDHWPREAEWFIDGQNPSGTEILPGYRLVFSASEFMSDRIHRIDAVASQSQVWEDVGTFRVAVSRNSLPPLAVIP